MELTRELLNADSKSSVKPLGVVLLFYSGCRLTQFYGYSKEGDKSGIQYDDEWLTYTYFLSSQETGFKLSMLQKFDVKLLIGQVSYKQKADIYNVYNGYDATKKERKKRNSEPTQVSADTQDAEHVSEQCR